MQTLVEKQVASVKRYIVSVLKDAGTYDRSLGHQIELVASDIVMYRRIREAALSSVDITTEEISREGYPRKRVNPLLFEMRKQSEIVQAGLDKLMMNVKSKKNVKAPSKDSLSEFMASITEE